MRFLPFLLGTLAIGGIWHRLGSVVVGWVPVGIQPFLTMLLLGTVQLSLARFHLEMFSAAVVGIEDRALRIRTRLLCDEIVPLGRREAKVWLAPARLLNLRVEPKEVPFVEVRGRMLLVPKRFDSRVSSLLEHWPSEKGDLARLASRSPDYIVVMVASVAQIFWFSLRMLLP